MSMIDMVDTLISVIEGNQDGWALADAYEYERSGHIGSDLQPYVDWWYGDRDDLPTPSLGSLNHYEELL